MAAARKKKTDPNPEEHQKARPFLKWVGGKKGLLASILPHIPEKFGTYYEPFLGGGAVFFALANEQRMTGAVLSDFNEELVITFKALAEAPELVISMLSLMPFDRPVFDQMRRAIPTNLPVITRAVRMIYLNKTAYNGLYRVNKKGEFNAPFGKYVNPTICDATNLRAVSNVLSRYGNNLSLKVGDFEEACSNAQPGDVVYFDPPYIPVSPTANFTGYTAGGFGWNEQVRLRDLVVRLAERGVTVIASNSDCDVSRGLYSGYTNPKIEVHSVMARRNINSKGDRRGAVGEILVVANGR